MIELVQEMIIEPMSFAFMQRAMFVAILIGVTCAVFSCFLVLKGWSLMGDAVSHAVLPGLVLAVVLGVPLMLGAFVAGLFCAVSIGAIKAKTRVKEDAVMGILFSGMFALGLVMLTRIETDLHLLHILFGNVLGVSSAEVMQVAIVAGIVLSVMLAKRKDLMVHCFDPVQGAIIGLPQRTMHYGLLALLSLTIVASLNAAGVILVIAMLIAPGAVGFILARSFGWMMVIAVVVAVVSCVLGVLLSFHLDTATAPMIVVLQAAFFLCAFVFGKAVSNHFREKLV